MTDDLTAALRDLADSAELPGLSPAAVRATAGTRRRRRRLAGAGTAAAVLLVAPLAWSAVPQRGGDTVVERTAGAPEAAPGGPLVSGTFELRYDPLRYDDRSDDALSSCDRVPGLLSTGVQLDSLPPIRGFWFAGSADEQDDARRCLEAMPAAVVAFEQDPFFVPVVLRASEATGPPGLVMSAGRLRPSARGWLEHDLTLRNDGSQSLVVDPGSLADLAGGAIAVSTSRCGAIAAPGGSFACEFARTDVVLAPGESVTTVVELERGLAGMAAVEPGPRSLTWTQVVTAPGGAARGELAITLGYEVLTAAEPSSSSSSSSSRPVGGTQTVQVFFSSTAPDADPCQGVRALPREVPATPAVATAALGELFAGPTPQEQERYGVTSAFSPQTADLLRSVRVEDGVAYVDLRPFDEVGGGATGLGAYSTSCGSVAFFEQVTRTLQQFPTVREVRFAFAGDPRAFIEHMQGGCPDPVPAGDPCDPEPFRR